MRQHAIGWPIEKRSEISVPGCKQELIRYHSKHWLVSKYKYAAFPINVQLSVQHRPRLCVSSMSSFTFRCHLFDHAPTSSTIHLISLNLHKLEPFYLLPASTGTTTPVPIHRPLHLPGPYVVTLPSEQFSGSRTKSLLRDDLAHTRECKKDDEDTTFRSMEADSSVQRISQGESLGRNLVSTLFRFHTILHRAYVECVVPPICKGLHREAENTRPNKKKPRGHRRERPVIIFNQ